MMENRGFDHYFGTLKGVRGFGDRHPVLLVSGKQVWFQSDGAREIPPYHLDTATTSAMRPGSRLSAKSGGGPAPVAQDVQDD
jgi:phospholipase C